MENKNDVSTMKKEDPNVRYNIEVIYLSNDVEETINVHYNSSFLLDEDQQNKALEDFLSMVKEYRGFKGIISSYIWQDGESKERINLNKLKNYKSIAYANEIAQLGKVKEEYKELLAEVRETSTFTEIKKMDNFKAEALDLITATVNLLLLSGLTEQDFDKHIEKLESYKNGKYKKKSDDLIEDTSKNLDKMIDTCREKLKKVIEDCNRQQEVLSNLHEKINKLKAEGGITCYIDTK